MKLDHVGIAVKNIKEALDFYQKSLGLVLAHQEEVPFQKVRVAFLKDPGESELMIELLEPVGEEGAIAKFLSDRGPGMHHMAFHSQDISGDMKRLTLAGKSPLESVPRPGARGHKVCFLHPRHAHGVLVELVGQ